MCRLVSVIALLIAALSARGAACVNFHDTASDTLRINAILAEASRIAATSERIPAIALKFADTPYVAGTLDGETECLTVNLDGLDCTTFVETVLALNSAAADKRLSWRDFLGALESIRYRGGIMTDYASRLHYISDWVLDNGFRGNLKDVAATMPRNAEMVKSLDFMTTHAESYPALADPEMLDKVKATERNFRNFKFIYVKSGDVGRKETAEALRRGDIVAFVTRTKGLDVTHMGIIDKSADGTLMLIHASSAAKKVVSVPLLDYLKKNPGTPGIRVFRVM